MKSLRLSRNQKEIVQLKRRFRTLLYSKQRMMKPRSVGFLTVERAMLKTRSQLRKAFPTVLVFKKVLRIRNAHHLQVTSRISIKRQLVDKATIILPQMVSNTQRSVMVKKVTIFQLRIT